jgi:radical SAM-linked protein
LMVASLSTPVTPPHVDAPERVRIALELSVEGDVRYLSHRDELRLLLRALVRAAWPLAYSRGFNPQPHLTIPLPRAVGTSAARQLALVDLRATEPLADLFARLEPQLPADYRLRQLIAPPARTMPHPQQAAYEVTLDQPDALAVVPHLAELQAAPAVLVERRIPDRPVRRIDIRPYLKELELTGDVLRLVLAFVEQRTARPAEVLDALGLGAANYSHRLRRTEVHWDARLVGPAFGPAGYERNSVDHEKVHSEEEDHSIT